MGKHRTHRHLAVAAVAASLLLGANGAVMAVECKGMEKSACERNEAQCSWVDGYTRSDGVKVSGHCRKKPGKKSSSGS
jgi:hypothetical protein